MGEWARDRAGKLPIMTLTSPAGGLLDQISVGLLTSSLPREVIDEAIAQHGKQAKRSDGKLPPHVMVYFAMALALFGEEDYEEVITRLAQPLARWGCWDWEAPTTGGLTQARQRLGWQVLETIFTQVTAEPVADALTRGAWLGHLRTVSIDGMVLDVPDSAANAAEFGYGGGSATPSAFPQVRVVTLNECGSHAPLAAAMGPGGGGKGTGEQSLARTLYHRLEPDMVVLADRNFYSFTDFTQAADTGAQLLWRVKDTLELPVVQFLADGSYTSLVMAPKLSKKQRTHLLGAARQGHDLEADQARLVRVIEYEPPDRGQGEPEVICLITTLGDTRAMPAARLAQAYQQRWESEGANAELKTSLRGPGRVLRSHRPDMVRQEIYGYLLTYHALCALICAAATEADTDPDRIKFTRTVRLVRRRVVDPAAFSP